MGQISERKSANDLRIVRALAVGYKWESSRSSESSPEADRQFPVLTAGFHRTVLQYVLGSPVASSPIADAAAEGLPVPLANGLAVPRSTAAPWRPARIPGCGGRGRMPSRDAYSFCTGIPPGDCHSSTESSARRCCRSHHR